MKLSLLLMTLIASAAFHAQAASPWNCSDVTLRKFQFGKQCNSKGFESAKDPSDKTLQINKECFVVVDISGDQKNIHLFDPNPVGRDHMVLSPKCSGTQGSSANELAKECTFSIYQGGEEPVPQAVCECSRLGCGQAVITPSRGEDPESLKGDLAGALQALSPACDDVSFSRRSPGTTTADGFYASSTNCPLSAEIGYAHCLNDSNPRNLKLNGKTYGVVCVPKPSSSKEKKGSHKGMH